MRIAPGHKVNGRKVTMSEIITPGDINLWVVLLYDAKAKKYWVEVINAMDNFPAAEEYSFTAIETIGPITEIEAGIKVFWKQRRDRKIGGSEIPNPPIEEET